MIPFDKSYPTTEHCNAANETLEFFVDRDGVEAVLLVNSCARGKATKDSCLDIAVLLNPNTSKKRESEWESEWKRHLAAVPVFERLKSVGRFSAVHLYFTGGTFVPGDREEVGEPDSFEIVVGNCLVYSVPLWDGSDYFAQLRETWLPYYDEPLRQRRLQVAKWHCLNDLDNVPFLVDRGLYFHAFERLHLALKSFLQGVFISRRTYPIAYNKWIQEQVVDILKLPGLYGSISRLFELGCFESDEIAQKARDLRGLVDIFLEP